MKVLGACSERKSRGKYICDSLGGVAREHAKVVYVGTYNYFSGHESHPIFSVQRVDKQYASS